METGNLYFDHDLIYNDIIYHQAGKNDFYFILYAVIYIKSFAPFLLFISFFSHFFVTACDSFFFLFLCENGSYGN
jgi:hypothetical protein